MATTRQIFCDSRGCNNDCPFNPKFGTDHGITDVPKGCLKADEAYENKVCAIWAREHHNVPDAALIRATAYYRVDPNKFLSKYYKMGRIRFWALKIMRKCVVVLNKWITCLERIY